MFVRLPRFIPGLLLLTLIACATPTVVDPPGTLGWTRQFGTSGNDEASGIATDANGNTYTSGYTYGVLEGTNAGGRDAFIHSYDDAGTLRWTRQFGTSSDDTAMGIATDGQGNVYAAGSTTGALDGVNAGLGDAFVRSYDGAGTLRWTRQFGGASQEGAFAIATDANGNVYAAGVTLGDLSSPSAGSIDAFVRSYDTFGTHRWTRQFGTIDDDFAFGIAVDGDGNIYAVGSTEGVLGDADAGGGDAFVRSYDRDGALRWTRQFGTGSYEVAHAAAIDANGRLHVTGATTGGLEGVNAGSHDVFVRSYDGDGALRWTRQFGTASLDVATSIATDAVGNATVAGYTAGALEGASAGAHDGFVRSYDGLGGDRWTRQFGTSDYDIPQGIAVDKYGNASIVGSTSGDLLGSSAGGVDGFVRTYGP